MFDNINITAYLIILPGLLIAMAFHEYAHALVADYLGDDTPYYQGRLTINPLAHIDWLGFLMLLIARFGWAKPVQVNPYNFKRTSVKQGMLLVSLAGPAMNFLVAIAAAFSLKMLYTWDSSNSIIVIAIVYPIYLYNVILGVFNLIPVPPLDGFKILVGILPDHMGDLIYSLERYGPLILILLVFSGAIRWVFYPLLKLVSALFGVPLYF